MLDDIKALKEEQQRMRAHKKAATKELRNAERRISRLKKRAKALSDADLLAVISLRNHEKALGKTKADGDEEEDEDSESEQEESRSTTASTSAAASSSPRAPKRKSHS